ncbi:MAG: hypothetical protein H6672_02635 [Anaerolineaceae bacterium]|nr:hypothetical protein [Anaerolineaceae bacterium]
MKRALLFVLVVALALVMLPAIAQDETPRQGIRPDAPSYAIRGPYAVGTMELVIEPDSDRPLVTTAWYPASNPEGLEEAIVYTFFTAAPAMTASGRALRDAEPDTSAGPYPLILLAHGGYGSRFIAPYYAEHLASHGFVVLAMDEFGETMLNGGDQSLWYTSLYYRPHDVTRMIDNAAELTAEGGALAGVIDIDNIGVTGASHGGYSTLASAGGRLSQNDFRVICGEHPEDDPARCGNFFANLDALATLAGLDSAPEGEWPAWGDPRVDAIVPIAPGWFSGEGVKSVTIPTLLMLGSLDTVVPNATNGYPIWENLGSSNKTLVEFVSAGHVFSVIKCADVPWAGFAWWCADPVWDMDRAHDLVDHFATAFFLSQLKGDADAAAALAPDAVNFPGIRYETTGY